MMIKVYSSVIFEAIFIFFQGYPWLILPWLILKFALMMLIGGFALMVVILMGIYKDENTKTGDIIAIGVCLAVVGGKY